VTGCPFVEARPVVPQLPAAVERSYAELPVMSYADTGWGGELDVPSSHTHGRRFS
jgi:hypothetical protein